MYIKSQNVFWVSIKGLINGAESFPHPYLVCLVTGFWDQTQFFILIGFQHQKQFFFILIGFRDQKQFLYLNWFLRSETQFLIVLGYWDQKQ